MTFSHDDPRPQLNVRIPEALMERIESRCRSLGTTKSDQVQTVLNDAFPPEEEEEPMPSNKALREAYIWLKENADDRNGMSVELAKTELAQQLGVSKDLVKQNRLKPLDRLGWIDVDFGDITVRCPEADEEGGK